MKRIRKQYRSLLQKSTRALALLVLVAGSAALMTGCGEGPEVMGPDTAEVTMEENSEVAGWGFRAQGDKWAVD